MVANVRNVWVDAHADGYATGHSFGPRAKDGGMELTVYVRHHGSIVRALRLESWCGADGVIRLDVRTRPDQLPDGMSLVALDSGGLTITSERDRPTQR